VHKSFLSGFRLFLQTADFFRIQILSPFGARKSIEMSAKKEIGKRCDIPFADNFSDGMRRKRKSSTVSCKIIISNSCYKINREPVSKVLNPLRFQIFPHFLKSRQLFRRFGMAL